MNGTELRGYGCHDVGNARRLIHAHGHDLAFSRAKGWLVYEEGRYRRDLNGEVERRAKRVLQDTIAALVPQSHEEEVKAMTLHLLRSQNDPKLRGMLRVAESEPEVARAPDAFDRDPWLLNVRNGTIDLKTGDLLPHDRSRLLTKLAPVTYDPHARALSFEQFLDQIMAGDLEKIAYLQRAIGYSLTGETSAQVAFLLCGRGSNGKGTLIRVLRKILGEYAASAGAGTFLESRFEKVRSDLAALDGARLVEAQEPAKGRRLDEAVVKGLTGEDAITARHLYQNEFTFQPQFKLWLAFNDRPEIRGTDYGIWRRLHLIDFPVTISAPDSTLEPRLEGELAGILTWAVRGCLAWQQQGLRPPASVQAATQAYREEQDVFGTFLAECCLLGADLEENASPLYERYVRWTQGRNEKAMTQTAFGRELTGRGMEAQRTRSGIRRRGLRLRLPSESVPPEGQREQCEQLDRAFDDEMNHIRARCEQLGGREAKSHMCAHIEKFPTQPLTVHTVHGSESEYLSDEREGMRL